MSKARKYIKFAFKLAGSVAMNIGIKAVSIAAAPIVIVGGAILIIGNVVVTVVTD